jgi:outer membrane protein OmpA-like peptidoglycan-associated protein
MLSSGSGGQPRRARGRVQADPGSESGTSGLRFRLAPAVPTVLALLLAGCSSLPSSMNPVTWWHDLQGGAIAEQRPPPPGTDQPYPNLATVPPKPAEPDRAALTNLSNGLISDRANAQHLAALAPLADPSSPSASPELFGKGTVPPPPPPPPPGTKTASASLPAAEAPAAPPTPAAPPAASGPVPAPSKAPIGAVQSAPLEPPAGTAQTASPPATAGGPQTTPPAPAGGAAQSNPMAQPPGAAANAPLAPPGATALPTTASAPPPPLPTTPPPPPNLGPASPPPSTVPATATASAPAAPKAAAQASPPAPPPAAAAPVAATAAPPAAPAAPQAAVQATPPAPPPAAAAPPPATPTKTASLTPTPSPAAPAKPNPADTVSITFITGSADLPALGSTTLKGLAGRRGSGIIAVTGYGEAASNDPDAQSAALTLGLSRAKAMAAVLTAAGVPATAVQVDAEAVGHGGTARLVQ